MTFAEFFKKKKIDLVLLQNIEPGLFTEFKTHYEQMGEKSFDHTKKYWFNQLRRRFPAPIEPKVERVIIENQIAEQTITDSLTEPTSSAPSAGFKPRFKPSMASKPTEDTSEPEASKEDIIAQTPKPAGFTPRFKADILNKPEERKFEPKVSKENILEEKPDEEAPKLIGFKPRFKPKG